MHNIIFRKLFNKKKELLILGAIVTAITIGGKVIAIDHWSVIDFNLTSYSPVAPLLGFIWAFAGMGVLYIRKIRAPSLWIIFGASLVYTSIMTWAMYLR